MLLISIEKIEGSDDIDTLLWNVTKSACVKDNDDSATKTTTAPIYIL